jgi:hypothetical protein
MNQWGDTPLRFEASHSQSDRNNHVVPCMAYIHAQHSYKQNIQHMLMLRVLDVCTATLSGCSKHTPANMHPWQQQLCCIVPLKGIQTSGQSATSTNTDK